MNVDSKLNFSVEDLLYDWRKFPLLSQQSRFRGVSLKCVDQDEFRTRIHPYISLWRVKLEEDRYFVENPKTVWGTRNLQNFVVDIFNHFYLTSCRTFWYPLHRSRHGRRCGYWMCQNNNEIIGWRKSANFQNGKRISHKQPKFNHVRPKTFHRAIFRQN